jgi:hypothetical protein
VNIADFQNLKISQILLFLCSLEHNVSRVQILHVGRSHGTFSWGDGKRLNEKQRLIVSNCVRYELVEHGVSGRKG